MATTDRFPDLNSMRFITDRIGKLVTLGNAIEDGALSAPAVIIAASAGGSVGHVVVSSSAVTAMDMWNGSFGLWPVFWGLQATSQLAQIGAAIASAPLSSNPVAALIFGSEAMLINIQVITTTQVYTPTAGTAAIFVELMGGGGGGGGAAATGAARISAGGGGGAGALAMGRITSGFSGVTVTIGAGGNGGAAGNFSGTNGGDTTFGSVLTAGGGTAGGGGAELATPIGAGATGTGGTASGSANLIAARGQNGYNSLNYNSAVAISGGGGSTPYGGGGECQTTNTSAAGNAATGFGAGGSGGCASQSQTAVGGGNGAPGFCIIWEYNGV